MTALSPFHDSRWHRRVLLLVAAANVFTATTSPAITIEMVSVGDPGNLADTATGYGDVSYVFELAKYETTVEQYVAFLNSNAKTDTYGLYDSRMAGAISRVGSDGNYAYAPQAFMANRPITYVDWFKAVRFANWMNNGQAAGSTETGAYTLNGASPSSGVQRNPNAQIWVPSENEWYKAAYYNATSATYWTYPTQTNDVPGKVTANATGDGSAGPAGNFANYGRSVNSTTTIGTNGGPSPYGAYDLGGNVQEWNDTEIVSQSGLVTTYLRGVRGSDYLNSEAYLKATERQGWAQPAFEDMNLGFRLAAVPEPSTGATMLLGLTALCWMIRRRTCAIGVPFRLPSTDYP
jgi:formylglycine-generating enzyme required for sulfatase activity